jgi:hypothetical protein
MMDMPPPPPPIEQIVVHNDTGVPLLMLGFVAFGESEDLDKLIAAAKAASFNGSVVEGQTDPEAMVIFPQSASRSGAMDLYHKALRGDFGRLRIEAMVVTVEAAADGIDPDKDDIRMYQPAGIIED